VVIDGGRIFHKICKVCRKKRLNSSKNNSNYRLKRARINKFKKILKYMNNK
jgi:hypothetical protein